MITYEPIRLETANDCLVAWGHRMGPLLRGNQRGIHHALLHDGQPVAVTMTSTLIRERVGGVDGLDLDRSNTVELSRLCAARPGLCRVALRLWREFVFPSLDGAYRYAISYQDAAQHSGDTYRFDGWRRVGYSHSGRDTRSGRPGRNKYIWLWERVS
jgi:antitoxin VapB